MATVSIKRGGTKAATVASFAAAACLLASGCGSSSQGTTAGNVTSANVAGQVASRTAQSAQHTTTHTARFSPAVQQAYIKFASCMRARGVSMPPPNIAGPGPVFDPRRIGTKSPHFASALSTCRAQLVAATLAATSTSGAKSSG
jgi:hypothetical protein